MAEVYITDENVVVFTGDDGTVVETRCDSFWEAVEEKNYEWESYIASIAEE